MKRKGIICFIIGILVSFCLGGIALAEEEHYLQFFFNNVCASCHEEDEFYELFNRCITPEEKQTITYEIRVYNTFLEANKEVYESCLEEAGKEMSDYELPVLIIDGQWLSGYDKIEQELHGILLEGKTAETPAKEESSENEGTSEKEAAEADGYELPEITAGEEDKAVLLFSTYSCEECQEIKDYLEELKAETDFVLSECNIAEGNYVKLFKEVLKLYGIEEKDGKVPAVVVGNRMLIAKEEIKEELPGLLSGEESRYGILKEKLAGLGEEEEISGTNVAALFGAGLLGGFNPCSISMLLMLFSILLTTKASVLKNGLLYLGGKYLTYLGLGVGICFAASRVDASFLERFGSIMNGVIVILFLLAAVMNFLDFLSVRKKEYGKVRMQLPKGLRRYNHKLLKKAGNMEGALLGILVLGLGIAVSLGEFFCTGQIYMASILYLLRNAREQFWQILGTLLVYVTAMCIPATAIMVIIHKTKGTGAVSDFMLKHMGAIKLLNSVLFALYALYFIL